MIPYIQSENACPEGLAIVVAKCDAWAAHNHALVVEIERREKEHLACCPVCNGLRSAALLQALWGKEVKVKE